MLVGVPRPNSSFTGITQKNLVMLRWSGCTFCFGMPHVMNMVDDYSLCVVLCSPVIIEVPHFASLRGKEREIVILRSDNGETWREHTLEATEEAVQEVLNESFDGEGG